MKWGSSVLQPPMLRSRQRLSLRAEPLPAAMLDLDPGRVTGWDEADLDLGRIGPVSAQVPEVDEPMRRLPGHDLAPLVHVAGRGSLEDPPADAALQHDLEVRFAAGGVVGRPPVAIRSVQTMNACSGGHATSKARRRGSIGRPARWRRSSVSSVLGREAEARRGVAPDLLEVARHRFEALASQRVDPARADALLADQPGLLEQPQMVRDCRSRDREDAQLADGTRPVAEQRQDRPTLRVAERLEWIRRGCAAALAGLGTRLEPVHSLPSSVNGCLP